jgi:hypothetical protein
LLRLDGYFPDPIRATIATAHANGEALPRAWRVSSNLGGWNAGA